MINPDIQQTERFPLSATDNHAPYPLHRTGPVLLCINCLKFRNKANVLK